MTIEDCIGMCRLTEEEIAAVAKHEHLLAILALRIGDYLCRTGDGELRLRPTKQNGIAELVPRRMIYRPSAGS